MLWNSCLFCFHSCLMTLPDPGPYDWSHLAGWLLPSLLKEPELLLPKVAKQLRGSFSLAALMAMSDDPKLREFNS